MLRSLLKDSSDFHGVRLPFYAPPKDQVTLAQLLTALCSLQWQLSHAVFTPSTPVGLGFIERTQRLIYYWSAPSKQLGIVKHWRRNECATALMVPGFQDIQSTDPCSKTHTGAPTDIDWEIGLPGGLPPYPSALSGAEVAKDWPRDTG